MEALSILLGGTGLILASVALWSVRRLYQEFSRVKREQYYLEQKVNGLPRKMDQAIDTLRIQTALLARGQRVSERLIRTGELYHVITGSEAVQLITEASHPQNLLLLDVRTPAEFAKQRIPGAKLIPVEDLEKRYQTEIPAAAEKVLVYCAGGERSRLACDFLSRQDYGNVYLLKNGLQEWPGPVEGEGAGTLIQISSKAKPSSHSSSPTSSSAQS